MKTTYLSCAETAKLVRAALKRSFPKVKFSVRSDTYSMGASIDVKWTDGPCTKAVDAVVKPFAGSKFDGMIDMKFSHSSWLCPDGTVTVASDPGSEGQKGVYAAERNWMPHPDAKLVHFGADYVFTSRTLTKALLLRAYARLQAKGYPVEAVEVTESQYGDAYVKTLSRDAAVTRGFDMEREVMLAAQATHCVKAC